MELNVEVTNCNVKTKKEKDYKYKATVVTMETYRADSTIVDLVNHEVGVKLHDVDFHAEVINVTCKIKKVNKVPLRHFVIKLEFEGTNEALNRLVNKSLTANLSL